MEKAFVSVKQFLCGPSSNSWCNNEIVTLTPWHMVVLAALIIVAIAVVRLATVYWPLHEMLQMEYMTSHPKGAVNYPRTLQINSHRMRDLLNEKSLDGLSLQQTATQLNKKYGDDFFVVEFRENGKRMFRSELRIRAGWMALATRQFRTDPETLQRIKDRSESPSDDDTQQNVGAIGDFDIFVRPIRIWDIRHWLNHPTREIRFAIWVAIFAATLEYSADIIELVQALFRA